MKKFNEQSAISILLQDGCEVYGKRIKLPKKGFSGLKKCSAYDYLINHCKFH
jgi:hypothetical protein